MVTVKEALHVVWTSSISSVGGITLVLKFSLYSEYFMSVLVKAMMGAMYCLNAKSR